jgi:phage tail sheath gpL-like
MAASIVLTGLAANDPVPGNYLQINFAQGVSAGSSSPREVLLMGNASAAGSATRDTVVYGPDTQVPLQTEQDAINLFGPGSELHIMFRSFTAVNQATTLRAIAVTSSVGSSAVATITIAGGTATGNGNFRFFYDGTFYDCGIVTGDTVTVIATNICAVLNAVTWLPFTANNTAGVILLTAKIPGPRGNQIRYQCLLTSGITTTTTGTTDTAFASGTTADSNVTALATIVASKYYRIVSAANDATQLGALATQVGLQAQPIVGIRQRAFAASGDTLANTITLATGINNARAEIVWEKSGPHLPCDLAANQAAVVSLFEDQGDSPRCNFSGFGNDAVTSAFWVIKASRDQTAFPTRNDIKSALNNGISPIGCNQNGSTYLVNRITTRSLSGSTQDYRIRDSHKVTICDFFSDDLLASINSQFGGKKISDDPPRGGRAPGSDVVTPTIFKGAIFNIISTYEKNDLLQNVPAIRAGIVVQRETNPATRMSSRIPLNTIDIFLQSANEVDQVG